MSEDGGDDSPPRPKRKIKKVMIVSSASESESDESVAVPGTRRKRLRVLSDEESSDSSGSSVVVAGVRRRRALPKLRDSDSDGSGGWVTESDSGKAAAAPPKPTSGFASDSSEGNSDKCSICLLRFTDQETGTPENCEHVFCFDCITEWSKNVNTCPVDRITFNSIIVRACMGGRVLRTEQVKVTERRPSIEMFVFEDITTNCEICRRSDNEDTMLLCDSCDLGYHMHCLTPPLTEIPIEQWLCPNCDDLLEDAIHISEVDELFSDMVEIPEGPRPSALRVPRNVRRSARNSNTEQPSTSSGRRRASNHEEPTTSRASRTGRPSSSFTTRRQTSTTKRRRKRRKAKTIVIEYEIEENGKFPITKRVTRRLKKRKTKRQPRTVARRTHVRASVRAKLASLKSDQRVEIMQSANAAVGVQNLAIQRHRAGIPSLSLMGDPNQLEYFSDEENHISEAATTAVATRPTANILSAYRQARRKMIAIPSPPHASAAPDVLSNILESQTLLHSKKSLMSISVDGSVNIKLQTNSKQERSKVLKKEEKVDLTKAEASTKKAPTYPGQSRGGGGWGGGYRGSYPRDHPQNNANGNFGRGGNYDGNYGGNYQSRPGQNFNNFQGNMRREEPEYFDSFPRRPHQFPHNDEPSYSDRPRRAGLVENSRGPNFGPPPQFQRNNDQATGRHSLNSSWPTYGASGPRADAPPLQPRHSFGGFENPVDMRMSHVPPASTNTTADYSNVEAPRQDKRQPPLQSLPESQPYRPLAQPPIFNFPKVSEVEKSEDERSDSGLVIDTEKYDPTEPTNDDDSGDEDRVRARRAPQPLAAPAPPAPVVSAPAPAAAAPTDPLPALPPPPLPPPIALLPNRVQTILAGIDTSAMNVPHNILDDAVRQVLKEHRNLMSTPSGDDARHDRSDEDSDGDCPNFSIYSATSVHIASNTNLTDDITNKPNNEDNLEDLIQEDDEATDVVPAVAKDTTEKKHDAGKIKLSPVDTSLKKTEEEYKEKVSKRCPITTVTRNPIKIKLNTPSLIKRQVSLYDEEEASQEPEESENLVEEDKSEDISANRVDSHAEKSSNEDVDDSNKKLDSATNAHFRDTFTKESAKITESPQNKETERKSVDDEDKHKIIAGDQEEKSNCPSERSDGDKTPNSLDKSDAHDDLEAQSDNDSRSPSRSPRDEPEVDKEIDNVEKMTESISETEDERSYTPCLDENKSTKDASFENDKDKGLEGLDTEMISEDEGNEMFSENEDAPSEASRRSPARAAAESEEGEIPDKRKERKKSESREESGKKKKKKESKKEGKDKSKSKKKGGDVSFKKLSKSGKERNYRDRDKDDKKDRDRRGSDAEARHKKRREKRKDLERYDVRTVVTEKRRKLKDPFGRDVSPRGRSPTGSRSPAPASPARRRSPVPRSPPRSLSPARRRSPSPRRSPAFSRGRRSPSPPHPRRSPVRMRRSLSRPRRSPSRARKSPSRSRKSPSRRSPSPVRRTTSRGRRSPARRSAPRRISPARARSASRPRRRRSVSSPRASPRRRSPARRKRRRSAGASPSRKASKKRKRPRSAARRASPVSRRRSPSPPAARPPSPRTPPSPAEREPSPRPRADRPRRRPRDAPPPSKEVFTSGDNILVSVSFKEQERGEDGERRKRKEARRTRRKRRRVPAETEAAKPVAIIDLERSPFRELTPSPKNVIVLSDSDHGEKEPAAPAAPPPAPAEPAPEPPALGPQTPPEPSAPEPEPAPAPAPPDAEEGGSPDAYDPFEPTRSASASPAHAGSPGARAASPPSLTLEAAQRSNLSADEVLARRPLSPAEKVLALLQSQRAAEPEPLPEPPRPEPPRPLPKLFPGKPSPIKSNPVKPMQAARLPWPPSDAGASPYSPGSSDFGELFEPPAPRRASKLKPHKKKGKTAVGVAVDEENLKILDELPSSAVALQVKNKFLKKLNRQERVVEEVKLVLKPHYNRRRVSKDEYKDILRRCVPKICHNKTGEINPTKIQALVEAYVKKFRKKRKLGIA